MTRFGFRPKAAFSALEFPIAAARPTLLPGSDGRPWLVANGSDAQGRASAASHRLYRFDPWQRRFDPAPVDLDLDAAKSEPVFLAMGSDAFVWLDQRDAGPALHGVRLGTRSIFSTDLDLVQSRDEEDATRPAHLAPDHPARCCVTTARKQRCRSKRATPKRPPAFG